MLKEEYIRAAWGSDWPITCFSVTDSTNLRLKEICREGDHRPRLLCAESQTAGRGRLGRTFLSPEGTGIYMSLLLPLPGDSLPLTIRAAVAVCRAVQEETGRILSVKWVNDLFWMGKKVCGILAEGAEEMAVLGIGLNLNLPEGGFPDVPIAGALHTDADKNRLIGRISFHVERAVKEAPETVLSFYRQRMFLMHKAITYQQNGQEKNARVVGVDDAGGLMVETADGVQVLRTGEVSVGSHQFLE